MRGNNNLTVILFKSIQLFFLALILLLNGCASLTDESQQESIQEVLVKRDSFSGALDKSKNIFVFLDGTLNDASSGTNVRRLYEALHRNSDLQKVSIYIPGVGTLNKPATGAALGRGMEERISIGYKFISQNYNIGDNVYIFGFSRGAHQARSLAGLLSYAGIPLVPMNNDTSSETTINKIIDSLKDENDNDYIKKWNTWTPSGSPLFASNIMASLKLEMKPVEIKFLGVWDTVPGSFFKKYHCCPVNSKRSGLIPSQFDTMSLLITC